MSIEFKIEWHEYVYPLGRSGKEERPQTVSYMACPAVCEYDVAAEIVESLVGLGGFVLHRLPAWPGGLKPLWYQTLDAAYAGAARWAKRESDRQWQSFVLEALDLGVDPNSRLCFLEGFKDGYMNEAVYRFHQQRVREATNSSINYWRTHDHGVRRKVRYWVGEGK